jgi:archaellum component FlaF (FlaF/FlaG flagellin family)
MALLTPQSITEAGVTPTLSAVNTTDTIAVDDGLVLHVLNSAGSPINVTFTDAGSTAGGSAATNVARSVTNGTFKEFKVNRNWVNPATGLITVTYSSTTTITAALKRVV